jgi:hypothetical protein
MTTTLAGDESVYAIDKRGIYYTLVLSLAFHVAAYVFISPMQYLKSANENRTSNPTVRIQFSPPTKPLSSHSTTDHSLLEEIVVAANRRPRKAASRKGTFTGNTEKGTQFAVSTQDIRKALEGYGEIEDTADALSENGAVVMDKWLLMTLNKAEKVNPGTGLGPAPGVSFDGLSLAEFIQVGNKCFQVELANPLDSLSQETWYRVKCLLRR